MKIAVIVMMMLSLAVAVAGCGEDEASSTSSAPPAASSAQLPADLVVADAPADAQDVTAVKKTAKDGDAIVIRGKIGGGEEPMAKNRAMMTILDPSVQTCDKVPGDSCKTPWDACCEPSEKIAANSATVQVVGADGKPLAGTLAGVANLKPLSTVTISGTARRPADSDVLIVEAKQIHVAP